jgi:hypothetical protein
MARAGGTHHWNLRPRGRFGARGAIVAFLVALFIAAPVLALQHESRFGAGDHDHDGTPCAVWLTAQGFYGLDTAGVPAILLPRFTAIRILVPPDRTAPRTRPRPAVQIRAPPAIVA